MKLHWETVRRLRHTSALTCRPVILAHRQMVSVSCDIGNRWSEPPAEMSLMHPLLMLHPSPLPPLWLDASLLSLPYSGDLQRAKPPFLLSSPRCSFSDPTAGISTVRTTTDGAVAVLVFRPRRRGFLVVDVAGGKRYGRPDGGGTTEEVSRAGGVILFPGMRDFPGGRRGVIAAGPWRARRGPAPCGGAGVPRRVLGLPGVAGPFWIQHLDGATEGVRGVASARHPVHAPSGGPRPRPVHRHRRRRHCLRRPIRSQISVPYHAGWLG